MDSNLIFARSGESVASICRRMKMRMKI